METELKFKLNAAKRQEIERILAGRGLSPTGEPSHYKTTYFDTAEFSLADAGYSLRIRQVGARLTQTLKGANSAPWQRLEKEWRLKQPKLDTSHFVATPLARMPAIQGGLRALFVTDIRRTIYKIILGTTTLELSFDKGAIRADKMRQVIHELEIELKGGQLEDLYKFAVGIHAEQPLTIETESKAARGYRLIGARQATPHHADPPRQRKDVTVPTAVRTIVADCIGHLLANLAALQIDIEAVHQARVSIRRLRSAFVLFKEFIEPGAVGRFETALRRFGQILGEARDWDVFIFETIPRTQSEGLDREWLAIALHEARAARDHAYRRVARLTASVEFTGFILTLAAWIEGTAWFVHSEQPSKPLGEVAPGLLNTLDRKALKRGRDVSPNDIESLHALRKTLKKLRYSIEFIDGIYSEKQVEKYVRAVKKLQKVLGAINDMVTTDRLASQLTDNIEIGPARGLLADWSARCREAELTKLDKAWSKFENAERFWL